MLLLGVVSIRAQRLHPGTGSFTDRFRHFFPGNRAFWPLWTAWGVAAVGAAVDGGWDPVLRWLPWLLVLPAFAPWSASVRSRAWLTGTAVAVLWLVGAQAAAAWGHPLPSLNPTDSGVDRVATARAFGGVGHQHVYWALYALLGGTALMEYPRWKNTQFWGILASRSTARGAVALLLLGVAWMGGSKIAVLAVLLGLWIGTGLHPDARRWRWIFRSVALLVALGAVLFIQTTDGRFQRERWLKTKPEWATGSVETRSVQWQSAFRIWQTAPAFGVGAAAKQDLLEAEYRRIGYAFGLKRRLNVHSLFIEFLLAYGAWGAGAVGVAVGASMRGRPVRTLRAWSRRAGAAHWAVTVAVAVVFLLISATESLAERALGVHLLGVALVFLIRRDPPAATDV